MSEKNPAALILRGAISDYGRTLSISQAVFADDDAARKHMPAYLGHLVKSLGDAMIALTLDALHQADPTAAESLAEVWRLTEDDPELFWEQAGALSIRLGMDWDAIEAEGRESWKPSGAAS